MDFDATHPVSDTAHNAGFSVFVTVTPPWIVIYPVGSASFLSYWPESLFRIFLKDRVGKRRHKAILVCLFTVVRVIYPF